MSKNVEKYFKEVLITEEQIQTRISELAERISKDYEGKKLLLLCILKGGVCFLVDLMRALDVPHEIDFLAVSSYGANVRESTGVVKIIKDLDDPIQGKHILIIEDIIDTGFTLSYLMKLLEPRNPASLKICTLLNKQDRRKIDIPVDYIGFDVPDKFVVGYGLDMDELYRELKYVAVMKEGF
ncbi:MAG: hypoxanthine phosphoribosyltransferase [Anaerolineaceae bacterium 4572_78]|nr:MAG: hypoxanthine phosphoribosyltransferase [Anaerolineaceae bacterium 4572_78]